MDRRCSHDRRVLDAVIAVEVERHLWMTSHLIDLAGRKSSHDPDRHALCGIIGIDWTDERFRGADSWLSHRIHGDYCHVRVSDHQGSRGGENSRIARDFVEL